MYKALNVLMLILVIFFIVNIFMHYSSKKNINAKNYNRLNANQILKEKISNLPILANDTDNVIEFNDSIETDFKNEKKRSFWKLLNK
tara:strand:- start:431 stop:691 length:261 start_codon:yes stop_codon:yes gene_type:complete